MSESKVANNTLTANGLIAPPEFPATQYEAIYQRITSSINGDPLSEHFSGAWNALAYRFCGALNHRDAFVASIQNEGSTPPPHGRYIQEKLLFDFFSSAFSTFESVFYGLYAIGAFASPTNFTMVSAKDYQKVSPASTRAAYTNAFPNDPILTAFDTLFSDSKFQQLREIRNILTHRSAPGRRMYVGIGTDDAPVTEWKLNNVPINETIVTDAVNDLSRLLTQLLDAVGDFTKRHSI